MGKLYDRIDGRLRSFIEEQHIFFVATAPLSGDGHINISPKGRSGTLAVLDEKTVAFLDFGGSHAGALYLFDGRTGALLSSLVGSSANEQVGNYIVPLRNGNYVVDTPNWNGNSATTDPS